MQFQIENLNKNNFSEWDQALIANKFNNPFQSGALFQALKDNPSFQAFGRIARHVATNSIAGGYCFQVCKELKGIPGIFSERVILNGGPILFSRDPQLLSFLLNDLVNHKNLRGVYMEIWNDRGVLFPDIFKQYGFKFIPRLNFFNKIGQDVDLIWDRIHKKRRINIKRYSKRLRIEQGISSEDLKTSYTILKETYRRIKLPLLDISVFKSLFEHNICEIFLAKRGNTAIATRITLKFNLGLYDWFAGDNRKMGRFHANDCIVWEIFKYGVKNNIEVFNFGGAGHPNKEYGPRDFKSTFGGELVNFGRYRYQISKKKNAVLRLALSIRNLVNDIFDSK